MVGAVLLVALVAAGCGARSTDGLRAGPVSAERLPALLHCLRDAGADARDVSTTADLQVSAGEVAATFSTFDLYIGLADRPQEAAAAAQALDGQLTVLQQAGAAEVNGRAVFYSDGVVVPAPAGRLVSACLDGAGPAATTEMAALAEALPAIELPPAVETRFLTRCRRIGAAPACGCAYRRAARLFRFAQVEALGSSWSSGRGLPLLAGVLRTCDARGGPGARL
jgi:hypothetical protein